MDVPLLPTVLFSSSLADVRALLIDAEDGLSFGQMLRRMTAHDVLFGTDAFIFLDGEEHRAERKVLSPPFHGRAVKSYEDAIVAAVEKLNGPVAHWFADQLPADRLPTCP